MRHQAKFKEVERRLASLSQSLAKLGEEIPPSEAQGVPPASNAPERLATHLALSPALSRDAILHHLLRCAVRTVQAAGAGLSIYDSRRRRLVFRAALGPSAQKIIGQTVPLKGSRHGLAFATGEVQAGTASHSKSESKLKKKLRTVLVAPLLVHGEPVGTISAFNKLGADHFTPVDMAAFKLFADLAALIVRQHSREQILRDGLSSDQTSSSHLAEGFSEDDRELVRLFETLAQLKQARPNLIKVLRQFVAGLAE